MMKKRQPYPGSKKRWIIASILLGVLILIVFALLLLNNVSGSTQPIKDVANQFKTPPNWTLESEKIEPPRFLCLNGGSCPQLDRFWTTDSTSLQEIDNIFKRAGWSYDLNENCKSIDKSLNKIPTDLICSIDAKTEHYLMNFYVKHRDQQPQLLISLYVSPQQ